MPNWVLYAALSAIFAAAVSILMKYATKSIDSDVATFYRTLVVVGVSALVVWLRGKRLFTGVAADGAALSARDLGLVILSGIATGLSWLAYFRAVAEGPLAKVSLIDKSSVILIVLAGVLLFGDQLTIKSGLGVLLVLAGLFLMFG